ncbi:homeodomain-interacting protein kinase 2-like [Strix aluco]|uniref:homeodomain-interacting protein kinase 2-like n=1 Tax=Strix aluco TaxID=111821 RepID=UPI003DA3C57E
MEGAKAKMLTRLISKRPGSITPQGKESQAWILCHIHANLCVTFPDDDSAHNRKEKPSGIIRHNSRANPNQLVCHRQSLRDASKSIVAHSLFALVCLCFSTLSKQQKNVISCVTVHDSPYSDSSSNSSPYSVQHRAGQNNGNTSDTKGVPETHCSGNPRTIIIPPLKTQASEVLVECVSLAPVTTSHHSSSYKSKSSSAVTSTSGHSSGSLSGAIAYRQQRPGAHFQQQQPLNLSQAQQHITTDRTGSHRRQQAYITPAIAQAPYSFPHNSPSHGTVHPHLAAAAAAHLPTQPHLYTYTAPAALGSTGTVAHLVASQGSARHAVQHTTYPASIVHQVPVSMGPRGLPSPTIHPSQYQAQFAHQTYISASPASTVNTGYPPRSTSTLTSKHWNKEQETHPSRGSEAAAIVLKNMTNEQCNGRLA